MTRIAPISRRELIQHLRRLGFEGPFMGGRHEFMTRGRVRLFVPNPHRQVISVDLLIRILRQAGISRDEWQSTE
jgi:predicted RNA binding protein YcfA (HicA-like mRNA interferase family)